MSWRHSDTLAHVQCDHGGCKARVSRSYAAGDEVARSTAWMYASEAAVVAGWDVPDVGEGDDLCPKHRNAAKGGAQ